MSILRYKRFTRPQLLQRLGRDLLVRFLERFQAELRATRCALPNPSLPDADWFPALARMLAAPESLPGDFAEALYAIDEMASPESQEQLELALSQAGLNLEFARTSTREDLALQIWLAAPAVLARLHNQQRMARLTAFSYFGTALAPARRPAFQPPDESTLASIAALLDPWFARHYRGRNTCRLELYCLPPNPQPANAPREFWFLVRHGDTFARAPKVEEQRTEIIHFRPQRDDVVVYSPSRDEIRINSRTRGECRLYMRTFGQCLRGSPDYFSALDTYTLEPLRCDGPDALQTHDVPGLDRIVLRAVQVAIDHEQVLTRAGQNLFASPPPDAVETIPGAGRLQGATFQLHFAGCPRPRLLQIRPPNILKLGRHCDVHLVDAWLSRRGFRRPTPPTTPS
jgi:hypothetical protein